jgi:lactoylglutathione lyase
MTLESYRMEQQLNIEQAVPFFMVFDIEATARFYIDGLAFEMTNKWIKDGKLRWCWLQREGAAVMLQEFSKEGGGPDHPKGQLGFGVSVCFICKDAVNLYIEFKSRGIGAKRPFVGNSMWVTRVVDPDGYALFFESSTDAPEDSELPE